MEMHNYLSVHASNAIMSPIGRRGVSNGSIGGRSANSEGKGLAKVGWEPVRHRHGNWDPTEVMALIKCKHVEHAAQKELMDILVHMYML